jgi:hypothetical protein
VRGRVTLTAGSRRLDLGEVVNARGADIHGRQKSRRSTSFRTT